MAIIGTRVGGLLMALILVAVPALSATADADLRAIPALHGRVVDTTGTLAASQREAVESKLVAFEQRKGAQIAVLIVPTTAPETIEQYATRVFDAWKLGRKGVDDGVLVIVAKDDRRVRIEVAYGLEGAIPDAAAKRVAHDYMSPRFAAGDFYGGIVSGADALIALIDDEPLPPPPARATRGPLDLPWWHPLYFAVGLLLGGISAVLVLLLFTRPRIYHALLGRLPERARPFAIGAVNALPIALLLRNPLSALAALLAAAGLAAVAGLSKPPTPPRRSRAYAGATSGLAVSGGSDGSGSSSSGGSESSSSSSSDSGGGGGSSGGGGASDSW